MNDALWFIGIFIGAWILIFLCLKLYESKQICPHCGTKLKTKTYYSGMWIVDVCQNCNKVVSEQCDP